MKRIGEYYRFFSAEREEKSSPSPQPNPRNPCWLYTLVFFNSAYLKLTSIGLNPCSFVSGHDTKVAIRNDKKQKKTFLLMKVEECTWNDSEWILSG